MVLLFGLLLVDSAAFYLLLTRIFLIFRVYPEKSKDNSGRIGSLSDSYSFSLGLAR